MDADHIKCNKEELLKCSGLFAAWKLGVIDALGQSEAYNDLAHIDALFDMNYEEARRILHPDTTLEALAEIEYYAGFNGKEAKLEAVNTACIVACHAMDVVLNKLKKQDFLLSYHFKVNNDQFGVRAIYGKTKIFIASVVKKSTNNHLF